MGVTFEERMARIEHNLDLLAAAQERLSAADERLAERLSASDERLASAEERMSAAAERLANNDVLIMNSLETRAEWEARMAARMEQTEKDTARHEKAMAQITTTLAEIGDKLNGLIGYVDAMRRDNRPPA